MTYPTKSETPKAATNGVSGENTSISQKDTLMNDSIIPAKFDFQGSNVRIVMRNDEPWFVASDICKALEYSNPSKAIADHLDTDERYNQPLERGGSLLVINESGLYALVLRSRKPEARKFAKWVTNEVLPSIRKTGSYSESITPIPNRDSRPSHEVDIAQAIDAARAVTLHVHHAILERMLNKDTPLHTKALLDIDLFTGTPKVSVTAIDPKAVTIPLERFHEVVYNTITVKPETLTKLIKACSDRLGEMATPLLSKPQLEPELRQRVA